jgi:hypothetical protein
MWIILNPSWKKENRKKEHVKLTTIRFKKLGFFNKSCYLKKKQET